MKPIDSTRPLYMGHPSCAAVFLRAVAALPKDGLICLMIPPVTPRLWQAVDDFLREAADWKNLELSLNDWGTLYKCAQLKQSGKLKASLTAGVLLAGQETDPLIVDFLRPEKASLQWRNLSTPSIFACEALLRQLDVHRVELCTQPIPFCPESRSIAVTCIRESIISAFPCNNRCDACETRYIADSVRAGKHLYMQKNLLLHPGYAADGMPGADRVVALGEMEG